MWGIFWGFLETSHKVLCIFTGEVRIFTCRVELRVRSWIYVLHSMHIYALLWSSMHIYASYGQTEMGWNCSFAQNVLWMHNRRAQWTSLQDWYSGILCMLALSTLVSSHCSRFTWFHMVSHLISSHQILIISRPTPRRESSTWSLDVPAPSRLLIVAAYHDFQNQRS